MKMRIVIEAARGVSPVINQTLSAASGRVSSCRQLLEDLMAVKSDAGRAAMLDQCVRGLEDLAKSMEEVGAAWYGLDSVLGKYRYKFDRKKNRAVKDLPGQRLLFPEDSGDKG